eukprot:gene3266-4115_t
MLDGCATKLVEELISQEVSAWTREVQEARWRSQLELEARFDQELSSAQTRLECRLKETLLNSLRRTSQAEEAGDLHAGASIDQTLRAVLPGNPETSISIAGPVCEAASLGSGLQAERIAEEARISLKSSFEGHVGSALDLRPDTSSQSLQEHLGGICLSTEQELHAAEQSFNEQFSPTAGINDTNVKDASPSPIGPESLQSKTEADAEWSQQNVPQLLTVKAVEGNEVSSAENEQGNSPAKGRRASRERRRPRNSRDRNSKERRSSFFIMKEKFQRTKTTLASYIHGIGKQYDHEKDKEEASTAEGSWWRLVKSPSRLWRFLLGRPPMGVEPISDPEVVPSPGSCAVDMSGRDQLMAQVRKLEEENLTLEGSGTLVLNPQGASRKLWDAFVNLMVMYVAYGIPFRVSFLLQSNSPGEQAFDAMVDAIFVADLLSNFITAIHVDNTLVIDQVRITKAYLKGWFTADFITVFPWPRLLLVVGSSVKVAKLSGMIRMLRLGKLLVISSQIENNSAHPNLIRLVKIIFFITVVVHWFACAAHSIATTYEEGDLAVGNFFAVREYVSKRIGMQYSTCLYWTTVTMMGHKSAPQVQATMLFTIVVFWLGSTVLLTALNKTFRLMGEMDQAEAEHRIKV